MGLCCDLFPLQPNTEQCERRAHSEAAAAAGPSLFCCCTESARRETSQPLKQPLRDPQKRMRAGRGAGEEGFIALLTL